MKLIKGVVSLAVFIVRRPYQLAQIRLELLFFKNKRIRTMAGYE